MELQAVTITRTETFLVWVNFARPDLEVTQRDAEILLGYMAGHDYELVLQGGKLFRHDVAEQPGEMQEYDIDDVIDIVCEWNYELKTDARHGMEDPKDFIDFCNYKDAFDELTADCENLDRLFARTKYGRANEKLVEQIVVKEMGVDAIKETIQKMADSEGMEEPEKREGEIMAKEVVKHYRLTSEDAKAFADKAKEAGVTESDYFRLLITQEPNDYPEIREGIKSLINEVNRIGVNVNEIVYNNNSRLYRQGDKDRLLAYMRRLNETVKKAVDDFGYH